MAKLWNNGSRFEDRVAIVTGAGGALGSAVALQLAREGAVVALGYRSSKAAAEEHVATIVQAGGRAHAAQLDVTDADSVQRFVEGAAAEYGGVDILINAAGRIDVADAVHFEDADIEDIRKLLDVDMLGTMRMCQTARPYLRADAGGVVVNFSGSYGNGVDRDNLVNSVAVGYSATKGAVRGFTASLARDLAPEIRVNAVSPGAIEANWEGDWDIPADDIASALATTPLKRMGVPEEIAETVLFLASDGGGYITGQVLQVDGGWVMAG
jgi:3-oxoacyl-[acyl-carrier protein] reductase